jgi:hypothetical protein
MSIDMVRSRAERFERKVRLWNISTGAFSDVAWLNTRTARRLQREIDELV